MEDVVFLVMGKETSREPRDQTLSLRLAHWTGTDRSSSAREQYVLKEVGVALYQYRNFRMTIRNYRLYVTVLVLSLAKLISICICPKKINVHP